MKVLTIDRLIELLRAAKKEIGSDKPIILTNANGGFFAVADHGLPPDEQNNYYHLSMFQRDSFGLSTWTNGKLVPPYILTREQTKGTEKIPSTVSLIEESKNPIL